MPPRQTFQCHPPLAFPPGTEDSRESRIYRKILGPNASRILDSILQPLALAVRTGSLQLEGAEGLEDKVAQLVTMACEVSILNRVLGKEVFSSHYNFPAPLPNPHLHKPCSQVWCLSNIPEEAPTRVWLLQYLSTDLTSGIYQAFSKPDLMWAVYSYFCWCVQSAL